MAAGYTGINIDGVHLNIDVKGNNGLQLAEPSKYRGLDNTIKKYAWIKDTIYKYTIRDIPIWLYDAITSNAPTISKTPTAKQRKMRTSAAPADKNPRNPNYIPLSLDMFNDYIVKPTQEQLDYWNLLSVERLENYIKWIDVGFLCYCMYDQKTGAKLWNEISKISNKYTSDIINVKWPTFLGKPKKKTMGSLVFYAEEDNPIESKKIKEHYQTLRREISCFINDYAFVEDNEDNIHITQRYLLDNNKKLDDEDSLVCKTVNHFFSEQTSYTSLNIKSPYDTGKTQLMKEILNKHNPRRVLWLSSRIAYTFDVLKSFEHEFNFKDYHKHCFNADRIIVQVESSLKLESPVEDTAPTYDLIVLDEIESLLKQFNSTETFKNNARHSMLFLDEIIKASLRNKAKIISMDGDLSHRGMFFVEKYGQPLNIINNINFNNSKLLITANRNSFINDIFSSLNEHKNIVIPTMSAKYANYLFQTITSEYPHLKVALYTTTSGGIEKQKLRNVDNEWSQINVLIYSPTITAGVSFDRQHFHKMFGVISKKSCTERDFHQMMRRVRKIEDPIIPILNYSAFKLNDDIEYYTHEKTREHCLKVKDINLNRRYVVDGHVTRIIVDLDIFDEIYIFNKTEDDNSKPSLFLKSFLARAYKKGFMVELMPDADTTNERNNIHHKQSFAIEEILTTADIKSDEADELLKKTCIFEDTKDDKLKLDRYFIKRTLGVDALDKDILQNFHFKYETITNFCGLIDLANIPHSFDNQYDELKLKIPIIHELIKQLGFNNIFDTSSRIIKGDFYDNINKLKNTNIFTKQKPFYKLFSITPDRLNEMFNDAPSLKNKLGYINSILDDFSLNIGYDRRRDTCGTLTTYYKLEHVSNITEIILYKMRNNFQLYDTYQIFKAPTIFMYGHLLLDTPSDDFVDDI